MYEIRNQSADTTEMLIYDDIGDSFLGGLSAKQVVEDLKSIQTPHINVRINSGGGSVFDGNAIYSALRRHDSYVTVDIDGLAASIASVIAMAGDEIRMADNALLMIHNAWTVTGGDANEFRKVADTLDKANETVLGAYERRGVDREQLEAWMDDETWFNAEEAEEAGFVDVVTDGLAVAAAVKDLSRFRHPPESLTTSQFVATKIGDSISGAQSIVVELREAQEALKASNDELRREKLKRTQDILTNHKRIAKVT